MTEGSIEEKTVAELVRSVEQNKGHYAFLIGAGSSKAAGIPTANELIADWKKERYEIEHGNSENKPEFNEWVSKKESDIDKNERYGFWFEECYSTEADRRSFIKDQVEDENPTFGIIVLSTMMSEGIVPVTLTPNFDDLLYDAFYLFLEDKPLVVNHDSLAPQYRLTEDRSTIIKLHGDYLYDNLQNIADETNQLKKNMRKALERTVGEYGLIVVGYGGRDNSIMDALSEMDSSPYGIWWCTLEKEKSDDQSGISDKAEKFLEGANKFLVTISGSEDLFTTLWAELDFDIPVPEEIETRAENRADMLREKIRKQKEQSTGKERQALEDMETWSKCIEIGYQAFKNENFKKAVEKLTKAIEISSVSELPFFYRGSSLMELGKYERAIEDFDKAIELDPGHPMALNNRGYSLIQIGKYKLAVEDLNQSLQIADTAEAFQNRGQAFFSLGKYERAIKDFDRAVKLDSENTISLIYRSLALIVNCETKEALKNAQEAEKLAGTKDELAASLMSKVIAKTSLGEKVECEEEYRKICSAKFKTRLALENLDSWLEDADVDDKDYIREIINLLKEHKA